MAGPGSPRRIPRPFCRSDRTSCPPGCTRALRSPDLWGQLDHVRVWRRPSAFPQRVPRAVHVRRGITDESLGLVHHQAPVDMLRSSTAAVPTARVMSSCVLPHEVFCGTLEKGIKPAVRHSRGCLDGRGFGVCMVPRSGAPTKASVNRSRHDEEDSRKEERSMRVQFVLQTAWPPGHGRPL